MKAFRILPALFIIVFCAVANFVSGQGQIITVAPSMVYPGQTGDIIIRGLGTSFKSGGVTKVDMGPGITVNGVSVKDNETIDAQVTVSKTAKPDFYDVTVTTGTTVLTKPAGIQVFQFGGAVTATLIVSPIQSMRLSDFDPNNLQNSPLLFTVTVINDAIQRNLRVKLFVSGQSCGEIATANKSVKNMSPNGMVKFDNRQFDNYKVSNTNNPAIKTAIQTGTLPSDIYTYRIAVYDESNMDKILTEAEGNNLISNPLNKPELISPGNPLYSDPIAVRLKQPLFQWFSQGNSFDFFLYEVKAGQRSAAEITLNRPVYSNTGLTASSLLYPTSAQMLENGKVYAWQVIANYNGSMGAKTLASDLFWFSENTSAVTNSVRTVAEIKIDPDQVSLKSGQTYKFYAKAYDMNNDTISVTPTWTVVPAEGGKIDRDGNFIAGNSVNAVAVIAAYGDVKDYATVTITPGAPGADAWGMDGFLKQLFGLPK